MKQFYSFIRKEFYHIFRDRRTMMILIAMPIVQIILFGFAITTEVKNSRIAVVDPSDDISTRHIIEQLNASEYFTVTERAVSAREADELFRAGEVSLAVVFGERFHENLIHTGEAAVQLIADASEPNQSVAVTNYASRIIQAYQEELVREFRIPLRVEQEVRMLYNPAMRGAFNFVPGVMGLVFILICAMMTSIAIVREKELGTMEVLLSSPVKPLYVVISKMVPYFVISCINLATILLLAVFVLELPIAGSLFWLCLFSLLYIFLALAIGMLISTQVNTQVAAMLLSGVVLMMPVMLLSGMIFPTENMPALLQWISAIIPARWYIEGVKKLMIQGVPASCILKEILILSAMAGWVTWMSLKRFKVRL